MRIAIIIALIMVAPITTQAFKWDEMHVLNRQVSPFVYDLGDSLLEVSYGSRTVEPPRIYGLIFRLTDTLSCVGRVIFVDPSPDVQDQGVTAIPLGDGWFNVVANRYIERQGNHCWPFLYELHISDTGFVEDRFREIDLPQYCYVLDAKPVVGGGYILLYTYGGNMVWWRVCRVTDEGDTLWTRLILEPADFFPYSRIVGILPSSSNPIQYYIYGHHFIFDGRVGTTMANITLIDTSGAIIWTREHYWGGVPVHITSMEAFNDGTYAIIGTRLGNLQYFHIAENGDSLASYRYGPTYTFAYSSTKSLVVGGERLLILTQFDGDDRATGGMGLLYINEEGDSLDGCYFHLDTVRTSSPGPMLLRPDGKVMLWVYGGNVWRGITDILYTFYPDGRPPDGVSDDFAFRPSAFILHPNYPNPFNNQTIISFDLDQAGEMDVGVFDLEGRRIATTGEGLFEAGRHELVWDASVIPSGIYLVKASGPGGIRTSRVVLVR